ncbi:MAG: hypothetical protein JXC32_18630 [Anaerolineae bacterium]|nr:hypothetical protein [Anaerolineae bacterium]
MGMLPFDGYLAKPIAEQMTSTREPFQLASPGILWRTLASRVRGMFDSFESAIFAATKGATYCAYNPAECRSVA